MINYTVKLTSKREIAEGTMAFHFEKPAGYVYKAGQYAKWALINPVETDDEGTSGLFSLACAPYENELMVATRMRDTAFKRALKTMELGTEVLLSPAHGSFILHDDVSVPAVFLTGGIGITPVRSIVLQAAHDKVSHRIVVFYSNRKPEDAAFLIDLIEAHNVNPNYTFVGTMTEMEKSSREWLGETGYINKALLQKFMDNLTLAVYYLVGPPGMVHTMRQILSEAGVDPNNIRTEEFSGY
jgi:ferredoxin-NADP reductase